MSAAADPLAYDFPLPLAAQYCPLGFPLKIETNSEDVMAAAHAAWSRDLPLFRTAGVGLRVAVRGTGAMSRRRPAVLGQQHLISIVQGPGNFGVCDTRRGFAYAWLTAETAAAREYAWYHFLEPMAYSMLVARHLTPLHASCVALDGAAVVLCGDSGDGKTSLAYACARRGWTYLSDDAVYIVRDLDDFAVVGRPHRIRFRETARRLFPELSGFSAGRLPNGKIGFEIDTRELNLSTSPQARVTHVVFLKRSEKAEPARLQLYSRERATRRLEQVFCFGETRTRREQCRTLSRLLRLPVLELHYDDTAAAEPVLRTLVGERGA